LKFFLYYYFVNLTRLPDKRKKKVEKEVKRFYQ